MTLEADADLGLAEVSTTPSTLRWCARGFDTEENARRILDSVIAWVQVLGRRFDLSGLDGVTIAHDYALALRELDRGVPTPHTLAPSSGQVVGVAMTPAVIRDGALKSHILIDAAYLTALDDQNHADFPLAAQLLAHECAHVDATSKFEARFPGALLRTEYRDVRAKLRWDCILGCWDEYAATRMSAQLGEDPTDWYEETFLKHLAQAREQGNASVLAYREHGDIDRLLSEVATEYGRLLKFSAYHLGNLDGCQVDPRDRPRTAHALCEHAWFAPHFDRLHACCQALMARYGKWTDKQPFEAIGDVLEDALAAGGVHLSTDSAVILSDPSGT